ncbi:hypothetical protein BsWGS_04193 [Bradybaena similaris]
MNLLPDVWKWLVFLFVFLFSYQRSVVKALACYKCNSVSDAACSTTSLDKFKTECKDGAVGCRKMHYLLDLDGSGNIQERIVRQCSLSRDNTVCTKAYGTNGKRYKQFICECNGDYCNRSAPSKPLALFVCVIALVTLIMLV